MPQQQKTRRQLVKMIARRLRPSKVRVASIQLNGDGSWHVITYGSRPAVENARPRIEAIVAKLRESYDLVNEADPSLSSTPRWLNWARGRKVGKARARP
jgi:hypothetical protein